MFNCRNAPITNLRKRRKMLICIKFQITITVTSVGLAFVSSVASSDEQSVLTAVQLMWINLFQDTLASLALATDPPSPRVLDRKPESKNAPLITASMWKMIIGQSVYQLAVTLILHFAGPTIFSYTTDHEMEELQSAVFNTYVWMQIFMMYMYVTFLNSILSIPRYQSFTLQLV